MKVLFSNPPWWLEQFTINDNGASHDMCLAGIRAGSRWPHTIHTHSTPDNFIFGGYLPYPFFMGYATTYAARATGAEVVMRDSLALRELCDLLQPSTRSELPLHLHRIGLAELGA